ncbi:MAG TPA: hypothetical protein VK670_03835 [Silvibacterium sp.]|nr:hypothetical protein [Silvibacterium sp.]
MSHRNLCALGLALVLSLSAAYAKKETRYVPPTPLTPEQAALVEKAVAREKATVKLIQKSTPVVQTYIQNMAPDPKLQTVPISDQYMVARVDFGKTFSANPYETRSAKSKGFFKGSMRFISDLSKSFQLSYSATGFMDMMFLDPVSFDQQHYDFAYVRRDFLGGVRTIVFDVKPKPKEGYGRFFGRVWIEDQDGNIVRFNGSYTGNEKDMVARYYHFDSWRVNVQPDAWLPTAIYVEETATSNAKKATGFRAQTYFWGYSLKLPTRESENETIEVQNAQDQSDQSQDVSPLQAQRQWVSQAENNVLDRLTQAGLLAPPSDFDKVLETVTNNIIIGNKLALPDDIHCRVLLTTPLESLAVGNTILISKGLADVLPSEESLAAVLSFQLAHIVEGHHIDTRYAFNDRLLFPDEATFQRFNMNHTPLDNQEAAKKAVELFNNSVYHDKAASVGLFFQALQMREKQLTYLLTPRLGDALIRTDGTPWLAALGTGAPRLNMDDLTQVAALPLNSRLKIDPWDDKVAQLNVKPAPLLSARDKMPFQVTPIYYRLQRYQPPATASTAAPANAPQASPPPAPAGGTQSPAQTDPNQAQPADTNQAQPAGSNQTQPQTSPQ